MTTLNDLASLAYDAYAPLSDTGYEDLSERERERWEAVARAVTNWSPVSATPDGYRARKLSDAEVKTVRRLAADGKRYQDIADHFGVSKSTIGQIVRWEIRENVG